MKSAFELALERSGGLLNDLSPEKKAEIAELDRICQAKIAAEKLSAEAKLKTVQTPEEADQVKAALTAEIASLRAKLEAKKQEIRDRK